MTAQIKVKVQRKAIVKLKLLPKFPSDVVGESGTIVTKVGGNYTLSLDQTEVLDFIGLLPGVNVQAQDADLQRKNIEDVRHLVGDRFERGAHEMRDG